MEEHEGERSSGEGWWPSAVPIVLITLLGAALRLMEMGQSLSGDELWSYVAATQPDLGGMLDFVRSDEEITPPLYPTFAWLSAHLGDATVLIRLPTVVAGIATIPIVWAIGLRTVGRRAALVAAALVALSPFLAFYAVEARAYSVAFAFAAASTLLMLIALERSGRPGAIWWVGYGVATCAAMYSHYTAAYVLAVQLGWLLWTHREAWKPALLTNALAALAFLPWVPDLLNDLDSPTVNTIDLLAPFNAHNAIAFTGSWALGHPANGLRSFWGLGVELILLAAAAAAIGGLAMRLLGGWSTGEEPPEAEPERRTLVLVVLLALATPVGVALVSLVGDSQFIPRNLGTSWPPLALALAAGLTAWRPPLRWVLTCAVLVVMTVGAVKTTTDHWARPDAEGAAEIVDARLGPDDVVLDALTLTENPGAPPAQTLDIQLGEPHIVIDANGLPAFESALDQAAGGLLAVVGSPALVDAIGNAPGLAGSDPVEVRTFDGTLATEVRIYEIPAAGG